PRSTPTGPCASKGTGSRLAALTLRALRSGAARLDRDALDHHGRKRFLALAAGVPEALDRAHDVHAVAHLADDRVVGRQARVGTGDHEELAAGGARFLRLGLRHGDHAARVL